MADELKAIEPDPYIEKLASFLGKYRDVANQVLRHTESGYGLGNLLVGDSPELVENMAYGSPPWRGKGYGTVLDPRLMDLVGVPIPGAGVALAIGKNIGKAAVKSATSAGRRDFLKKAGAGAALAALPAKGAMSLLKDVAPTPRVAGAAAVKGTKDWAALRAAILKDLEDSLEVGYDPIIHNHSTTNTPSVENTLEAIKSFDEGNYKLYLENNKDPLSPHFSDAITRHETYSPEDYMKYAQEEFEKRSKEIADIRANLVSGTDEFLDVMKKFESEFPDEGPEFYTRMMTNDHFGFGPYSENTKFGTDPRLKWYSRKVPGETPDNFIQNEHTGLWQHPDVESWSNGFSYATPEARAWLDKQDPYDILKMWWTQKWPKDAPIDGFDLEYIAKYMNNFPENHPKAEFVNSLHKTINSITNKDPRHMGWEVYLEGS